MTITELVKKAHDNAVNKGFYGGYCVDCKKYDNCDYEYKEPAGSCDDIKNKDKNIPELLMLIVSELSEAMEAHRENKFSNLNAYYRSLNVDDINECDKNDYIKSQFKSLIKSTFEDELADAMIRIADLCGYMNIDLEKHIELKMAFNLTREYKHGKKY
jgi:NTP pyrophosphatase (non-canonical NTP hydrolase)